MENFKEYQRTQKTEMRPVTKADISAFQNDKTPHSLRDTQFKVSISEADLKNGSPKIGDMIARNPKNHNDQWLVADQYFKDNFESIQKSSVSQESDYIDTMIALHCLNPETDSENINGEFVIKVSDFKKIIKSILMRF